MTEQNERKDITVVHEVIIDGKEYISTELAQELTRLTSRHIARLCREGRNDWTALHVGSGKTWFILKDDVLKYQSYKVTPKTT